MKKNSKSQPTKSQQTKRQQRKSQQANQQQAASKTPGQIRRTADDSRWPRTPPVPERPSPRGGLHTAYRA